MQFELNHIYSFNTHAPTILGATYKNMTVLGILDYTTASNYITPETAHVSVFPYLPSGTPRDPKKYVYILFKSEGNQKVVLGLPWIDLGTINETISKSLSITVDNVSTGDAERIRDSLLLLGLQTFEIIVN